MNRFMAKHAVRSHVLRLNDRPKAVLELFEPIGEKKWSDEWNPTMIFPASTISKGTVFTTKNKEGPDTAWIITELDKENCKIAYTAVTPFIKVTVIEISCDPDGANHTKAHVTYAITALSEDGNRHVDFFSEEHYRKRMTE